MQSLRLSCAIDAVKQFIDTTDGFVHVADVLYPLFIQVFYPDQSVEIESFIELLYRVWLDPSPERIVFLPDVMQDKFVRFPDFIETVKHVYPEDHHEKIAFLDFASTCEQLTPALVNAFAHKTKIEQCQKLQGQGVRIVGIEDAIDHEQSHMVLLTYRESLPAYKGQTQVIMIEDSKNNIVQKSYQKSEEIEYQGELPSVLPIQSIKLLFNDPDLFYERYILNLRSPYQPTHHLGMRALKEFLLFDKPIPTQTVFDQCQMMVMKEGFEKFKSTLPKDVVWNKEILYDVPDTKQTLHGMIDLVWDGGVYQITKQTPPSRNALLNGLEPELPLLAAGYGQPITHMGYIHIKGHGEDAITITRYNDPSALISENIKKLAYYHSRSQEESA